MSKQKDNLLLFFIIFLQVKESQCNTKYVHIYTMDVFTLRQRVHVRLALHIFHTKNSTSFMFEYSFIL